MFQPFPCLGFTHYYAGSVVFSPILLFLSQVYISVCDSPTHATEHISQWAGLVQSKPAKLWSILSLPSKTLPHTECLFPSLHIHQVMLSLPQILFLKEIDHLIHSH